MYLKVDKSEECNVERPYLRVCPKLVKVEENRDPANNPDYNHTMPKPSCPIFSCQKAQLIEDRFLYDFIY